jgi:hypothetical protein
LINLVIVSSPFFQKFNLDEFNGKTGDRLKIAWVHWSGLIGQNLTANGLESTRDFFSVARG